MRASYRIAACFFIGCAAIGFAQKPSSVTLGVVELRMGITMAEARSQIAKAYGDPDFMWEGDTVMVVSGKESLGSLSFSKDKLVSIEKSWRSSANQDAIAIGRAIYSVISQLNEEGQSSATVKVRTTRHPEFTHDFVEMTFGSRIIQIRMTDAEIQDNRTDARC